MLVSPLPTWKQLLLPQKNIEGDYWKDSLWLSRSGVSIRLLIETYKKVFEKNSVNIWIPEFFCAETEEEFIGEGICIVRYPITKELEPDWDKTKQLLRDDNLDIFIFVHYFGEVHDISMARQFCDKNKAMLIEDCAHVLYKYGKVGQKGDFVIYSPHKLLPIPDGAIVQCNSKNDEKYNEIYNQIQTMVGEPKSRFLNLGMWKAKKIIQKIFRVGKPVEYDHKVHFFEGEFKRESNLSILKWSYNFIQGLTYEDYKTIAYIRRDNMNVLTYLIQQIDPLITPIITVDNECPFFAVYSLEKVVEPMKTIEKIQALGIKVMYWPSLAKDVEKIEGNAQTLSRDIFIVPIHQGIQPHQIARRAKCENGVAREELALHVMCGEKGEVERWNAVLKDAKLSNMTQDWYYGEAKHQAEQWGIDRVMITKRNEDIGVVQVLKKKLLGITVAIRINQGPVFVENENIFDNELEVINKLKKNYLHIPFLYVPFGCMTGENYTKIVNAGWRNWNLFGFPSGSIDLTRNVDDIRASLDSKWRNQLKAAEKNEYVVHTDFFRFDEMLKLYKSEQQEKGFVGVKDALLKAMRQLPDSPLRIFYIENENREIIAYDIFYRHVKDATYYIGWNSNEGRKKYLNNLLLYYAAVSLKAEGVDTLDLGGIEYIHTESIAKFKDGMHPEHYRRMGEFIKI